MTSQAEYNAFVQRVTTEAQSFGLAVRHRPQYYRVPGTPAYEPLELRSDFEVYWNDEWIFLGRDEPFKPDRRCIISEPAWDKICYAVAGELAK